MGDIAEERSPETSPANDGVDSRARVVTKKKTLLRMRSASFNNTDYLFADLVQSSRFERAIGFIILLNVAFMGFATDRELDTLVNGGDTAEEARVMNAIELVFCLAYVIELAMRLVAFKARFFFDQDRYWNFFDMLLVVQSTAEQLSNFFDVATMQGGSLSFLRAMRLIKMIKMLRVVRLMRSMREMRMILHATMGCMRSMIWSLVLLCVVLFMFALIFVQGVVNYMLEGADELVALERNDVLAYWGSVGEAMITLFKSSAGGMDWEVAMDSIDVAGAGFALLFLLYIAFFIFVVLNTITALFVEHIITNANRDFQSSIQNELEKKEEYVVALRKLFEEMDLEGQGEVSLEEFETQIENPKLVAFFASLEIEITDATHFFEMLSDYGAKRVTLDTFVTGCIRMRGQALAVDMHYLTNKHAIMHQDLATFMNRAELRFEDLRLAVVALLHEHGDGGGSGAADSPRQSPEVELAVVPQQRTQRVHNL